jgi:hypothetical protein
MCAAVDTSEPGGRRRGAWATSLAVVLVAWGCAAPGTRREGPLSTVDVRQAECWSARWETYTVRRGDTLWSLGRRFGLGPAALARANGMGPEEILGTGRALRVPAYKPLVRNVKPRP